MAAIIRNISRGTIEWIGNPYCGTQIPKEVEGVDMKRLDPSNYYTDEQIAEMANTLNKERVEYLAKYRD